MPVYEPFTRAVALLRTPDGALEPGAVTFTNDNVYTGLTTIASGAVLQLGNNSTSGSITGSVANNGSLIFNRSSSLTYSGVVSGSGIVSILTGTVNLNAASSYTGGTSIASGATLR